MSREWTCRQLLGCFWSLVSTKNRSSGRFTKAEMYDWRTVSCALLLDRPRWLCRLTAGWRLRRFIRMDAPAIRRLAQASPLYPDQKPLRLDGNPIYLGAARCLVCVKKRKELERVHEPWCLLVRGTSIDPAVRSVMG